MTFPILEQAGRTTLAQLDYAGSLCIQLVRAAAALRKALPLLGNRHRWQTAIGQMLDIGVSAAPMVGVMGLCAGFILALQGASELKRFGAIEFVVELVTIGFVRELGPLLTAMAVSGRSGSAFSAEIGSMVVTEEVDALRTMAIDPIEFLLAPKYLAALLMLPCLSIVTDACGILAGGVFMHASTGMPAQLYLVSVARSIALKDVTVGLVKSVAFATIIVHVGCLEGFRVRGGPDAVGRSTTAAVVKSTFLVILADLAFTAVLYMLGGS